MLRGGPRPPPVLVRAAVHPGQDLIPPVAAGPAPGPGRRTEPSGVRDHAGLLQTEAYARAVLAGGGMLREAEIEQRVTSRLARQAVLTRDSPPEVVFVVDEAVLRRRIGSRAVMAEQFAHLLHVTELPQVDIHVVPADAGMHAGLAGAFIVVRTPEGGEVAHLDTPLRAHVSDRSEDIDSLQRRWENLRGEALPRKASRELLAEVAESWS
ncbi:DUF5753 domain-containing protein [Micromonospora sp. NPDC049051]|uniref:DUF5753 domain-containing protein n=1 Tax=unclassified Micromonospora TaxID=2617518 RepID=UPI003716C9B0